MKREIGLDQVERTPESVLTVGGFDGVHRGHRAILEAVDRRARRLDGPTTVVTFDPHPREVLSGTPVPLLTTVEERANLLEELGIDRMVVIEFTREFSRLPPDRYVEEILLERIGMQEIVVGYDHRFGREQAGDTESLRALGREHGFDVEVVTAQELGDRAVSSSQIRELLRSDGNVRRAAQLLTRPYELTGIVVEGEGRGQKIGYPTANLRLTSDRKVVPAIGVYAIRARLPEVSGASIHGGMMNIGVRPTFESEKETVVEAHLFDFSVTVYGERMEVELIERIRDEKAFSSVEDLVEQLREDEARCKELLEVLS